MCNPASLAAAPFGSQVCNTTLAVSILTFTENIFTVLLKWNICIPSGPGTVNTVSVTELGGESIALCPAVVTGLWYIHHLLFQMWVPEKHFFAIAIQVARLFMCSGGENSLCEASIKEPCQSQRPYRCSWVIQNLVSCPNRNPTLAPFQHSQRNSCVRQGIHCKGFTSALNGPILLLNSVLCLTCSACGLCCL